jgi:cytochrome c oxidase assembly protein subunit 15
LKGSAASIWLHRLALLTAVATFPLLFVGGLVTSTGSALAVPDWPTTFGHNMFLYPWSQWVGGIFYEHSHRLLGACVGILTTGLTLGLWWQERRAWLRWLGSVALAAVILQGVLGGLRVLLLQPVLAIVHACLAQAFFALLAALAVFTAPHRQAAAVDARLRRLCLTTTALIYGQIVLGAVLRHTGTGLVAHLLLAGLVGFHVGWLALRLGRLRPAGAALLRPTRLLVGLLLAQLALGVGAYLVKFTATGSVLGAAARVGLTTTHLAVGSLMLVTALVVSLRTVQTVHSAGRSASGRLLAERVSS